MKEIKLTQGYIALVDDVSFEKVKDKKYFAVTSPKSPNVYACRKVKGKRVWLAYDILGVDRDECRKKNLVIDHINNDTLDNRLENLRLATISQNNMNTKGLKQRRKKRPRPTSQYKGVSYSTRYAKWKASIHVDMKEIYLGRYESEQDAALAYNAAALFYYGEFATLNPV